MLKVNHVIVCGHYRCGGVKAVMGHESHGLIDNGLRTLKNTHQYWQQLGKFHNGIVGGPPRAAAAQHDTS